MTAAHAPVSAGAVILDFDGVIADTERLHLGAFQRVFAPRGWLLHEQEYFERYIGFDDRGLVVNFLADRGLTVPAADVEAVLREKAETFRQHLSSTDILYPGAHTAIAALAARYPLAIASGALHHEIVGILAAGGLSTVFRIIVAADDIATTKPSPEPYLAAADRLGVAPASCVAVEDSPAGLEAARGAGMRTIAVTTTSPVHALLGADRIVAGLYEVTPDLIAELGALPTL